MFSLAIIIGIYVYLLFDLGLLRILYRQNVFWLTIIYVLTFLYIFRHEIKNSLKKIPVQLSILKDESKKNKLVPIIILIIILQALINLVGVLGPELSFDSLWYHLTLPKLYLENHAISYIPGNILYYSLMPKLSEVLYVPGLLLGGEIAVKFTHFLFGLLCLAVIYKIARNYLSRVFSLLAVVIFYSNLVVAWESMTAYVDLTRTFFEALAFLVFIFWAKQKQERKYLILSAIFLGLAITAKLAAAFSIIIFIALIIFVKKLKSPSFKQTLKELLLYIIFALLIPLPWFVFSYLNTGNPIYPYFSLPVDSGQFLSLPNLPSVIDDLKAFFLYLNDPISPIYLILLPVFIVSFKKYTKEIKMVGLYCVLGFIIWYLFQQPRGGRFILPYLPIFSVLAAIIIDKFNDFKLKMFLICIVILIALTSIFYRGFANKKYIPFILGNETKSEFLSKNLNFAFGDFYDTDDYFKRSIKSTDKVLLYGFHNLYYIDFPHIDSSWIKQGDTFNYVAVQNGELPDRFKFWNLIYYNPVTNVGLYSLGGQWQEY